MVSFLYNKYIRECNVKMITCSEDRFQFKNSVEMMAKSNNIATKSLYIYKWFQIPQQDGAIKTTAHQDRAIR